VVIWQGSRATAPAKAGRQARMAAKVACSAPELTISASWKRTSLVVFSGTHDNRAVHAGDGSGGGRSSGSDAVGGRIVS
jgi:hypothetical protein